MGPPLSRELPLTVLDSRHAYTRLPSDLHIPAEQVQAVVTTDQDAKTRGRFLEVGTPNALPLRLEPQDMVPGFAPLSLVGAWDIWPMLGSGMAGFRYVKATDWWWARGSRCARWWRCRVPRTGT